MDPETRQKIEQIRLEYRLRKFFRYRWKQLVCQHRDTYRSVGWTSSATVCSKCHFTLSSKGHQEKEERYYTRPTFKQMARWILTGEAD